MHRKSRTGFGWSARRASFARTAVRTSSPDSSRRMQSIQSGRAGALVRGACGHCGRSRGERPTRTRLGDVITLPDPPPPGACGVPARQTGARSALHITSVPSACSATPIGGAEHPQWLSSHEVGVFYAFFHKMLANLGNTLHGVLLGKRSGRTLRVYRERSLRRLQARGCV